MSVNNDIRVAVFDRISTADILPVAWPNVHYDGTKPYCRVFFLSVPTSALGIRQLNLYEGIVQVDVVVSSGVGEIVAIGYCDQFINLFPRNLYLTQNTTEIGFIEPGYPGPAIQEDDGYFLPVSIPYKIIL